MRANGWRLAAAQPRRVTPQLRLLGGTRDLAALEATGADVLLDGPAVLEDGDALDVGLELAGDGAVGVAD